MYKYFEPLPESEVSELIELSKEVKFTKAEGYRRRRGANAPKVNSVYNFSMWFNWRAAQRKQYKDYFPATVREKIVQGWFLELPPHVGFLDLMDYWVGKPQSGRVIATALKDQSIWLDGKEQRLSAGQQIGFSLETLHEIKTCREGGLWACVMFMGCYTQHED